jgi:hypothetical protein
MAALAWLALLAPAAPTFAARGAQEDPCAVMGTATVAGVTTPTCRRFHDGGAAIRLPADAPEATYGLWDGSRFLTRGGTLDVRGDGWEAVSMTSGLYLRAQVSDGVATDPVPALLVRQSAVLQPLVGLQAVARIEWLTPPDGVKDAPVILRFPRADVATVSTYRRSIAVKGACIPDLTASSAARQAYAPFFGEGRLRTYWTGGMHAPLDSEIVIDSATGPSWMTRGPALIDLLDGPWRPARVSFSIHANPMGTPASITGSLGPARGKPC